MTSTHNGFWRGEHALVMSATPDSIWRFFSDVPGWVKWNSGIEKIEIDGPFEVGTYFWMTPPGHDALTSLLIEIRPTQSFTNETRVGDLVVRVTHRIEALDESRSRVTYSVEAEGEGATEIGPMISQDFPEVLMNLGKIAEGHSSLVESVA